MPVTAIVGRRILVGLARGPSLDNLGGPLVREGCPAGLAMADAKQSQSIEIEATPEQCFETIVDFADYPNWSSVIVATSVADAYPDGLPRRVRFELDMKVRTVRYTLDYAYERPRLVEWKLAEGDVESVEGSYRFEPAGKGRTRATCEQAVSVGFWIPGPIRRIAEKKALEDSVREFKAAVEKRVKRARPAKKR